MYKCTRCGDSIQESRVLNCGVCESVVCIFCVTPCGNCDCVHVVCHEHEHPICMRCDTDLVVHSWIPYSNLTFWQKFIFWGSWNWFEKT